VRREIKQPVFGQADDDTFARAVRKNVSRRNQHFGAGARQPRTDAGVRGYDFFVTHAVLAPDVEQRVFVGGHDLLHFSDHCVGADRQRIGGGQRLRPGPTGQQQQRGAQQRASE
jgi:hypothetical protein